MNLITSGKKQKKLHTYWSTPLAWTIVLIIVPGPPRNLHVVYSSMNCSQVFITWDPPESERGQ